MSTSRTSRFRQEEGVALIMAVLIMMLMSALMIGFGAVVASDQKFRYIDRDRNKAFYAAQSGLEKLTADFANLFFVNVAPTPAQIAALGEEPPTIPDVTFSTGGAGTAYGVTIVPGGDLAPAPITTGPYQGLVALKKIYALESSVRTAGGGEAHLSRRMETVAIPVFQFGMFSDVDLSFSAAADFDFGGRVHTNGNLFLAQGGGATSVLWLRDKVTAVKEIVRERLSNGASIDDSGSIRTVKAITAPGAFRILARNEGSVVDGPNSAANSSWQTTSLSTYNGNLRSGKTGAKPLNLPLITTGGVNADLVRRPIVDEHNLNATLLGERYFSKVSLRVLLSDTVADIQNLPTVTATQPVSLDGNWLAAVPNNGIAAYGPIDAAHPPVALTSGPVNVQTDGNSPGAGIIDVTSSLLFRPSMSINLAAITCTGKNANQFTGCTTAPAGNPLPAWAVGAVIEGPVGVTTTTTAAYAGGGAGPVNINVAANGTVPFVPTPFWSDATAALITCTGWTAGTMTGCAASTGGMPGNNVWLRTNALSPAGTGLVGGFIKIEKQTSAGVWQDVTMEILNYGIGGPNLAGQICADPTPNAIIRIQRLRDNTVSGGNGTGCTYAGSTDPANYWANMLFDAREAVYRDAAGGGLLLGGVMHYIALDVRNLSQWFQGQGAYAQGSGTNVLAPNGFSLYFSDRRNNRDTMSNETGEYGFEDVVNPASGVGAPNGTLDAGEDMNGSGTLENYGRLPSYNGVSNTVPPGAAAPLDINARPTTVVTHGQARVNRGLLFRHALKLVNGGLGNLPPAGLTISAENPIYIHGDFNAGQSGFSDNDGHVSASVVGDAVTLLSNNWNDTSSFTSPYATGGRVRSDHTWYRAAIIAGKGPIFPRPNGAGATFGTDGGAHSFLRFLEGAAGADTIHYKGSLVTFFYSRQAVSPFKCCGGVVYDVPARDYTFDVDFLNPARLPPLTPVFRDLNALGFTQETRPGR